MDILQHGQGKVLGDFRRLSTWMLLSSTSGRSEVLGEGVYGHVESPYWADGVSVQACVVKVGLNLLYAGCQNTTLCQCSQTFLLHRT